MATIAASITAGLEALIEGLTPEADASITWHHLDTLDEAESLPAGVAHRAFVLEWETPTLEQQWGTSAGRYRWPVRLVLMWDSRRKATRATIQGVIGQDVRLIVDTIATAHAAIHANVHQIELEPGGPADKTGDVWTHALPLAVIYVDAMQ